MRDGRRQRLGLGGTTTATLNAGEDPGNISTTGIGTLINMSDLYTNSLADQNATAGNPDLLRGDLYAASNSVADQNATTGNKAYLDRILDEQGPDTLNLDPGAYVDTRDNRYINDAYNYYLGGGTGEVPTTTVAPDFTGGELIDTGGGGQDIATSGLGLGDTTPIDTTITPTNLNDFDNTYTGTPGGNTGSGDFDLIDNSGKSFGPYSQTPVTPNETSLGNTNTGLEDYLNIDYTTPVNTPSGRNPFGYEDLNPSALAGPGINETSGLDDIGADIGVDNTVDYGMPQGSPGQLNPAAPSIDDITGLNQIQDSPDMDDGIGLTRQELYEQQDTSLTETLKNKFGSLLPENFNVGTAIGKIFVNSIVGKPITLAFDIAKSIFGMLPEGGRSDLSNVLGEQYGMDDIGRLTGGPMAGYSVDSAFGDIRQATVDRINSIKNRTITQTPASIAKIKELEQFLAQVDYIGGDPIGANTDIDIDTGNVTGDASVAEDAQDLNLTEVKDDMADINTGDAGIAEQIEADNRAAEAQAAAAREAEIDANREAAKDAQNEQNAQNARDAAAAANAAARQQALADLYRGGGGDGGGGGGSGDGNSPGGGGSYCFDPSTPIQMADGSIKEIKNIQLGDDTKGGEVTGVFQFKASDDIHNYKGVTVAGGHYVKENNEFIMVKDSPLAVKMDKIPVVYSLDTANRRIFIKDIEFADYNGDGVAKNFLSNAGVTLEGFDKEVLRQVEQRLI